MESIGIVFFIHSLNCGIGGMEAHQRAFIKYFCVSDSKRMSCRFVVENYKGEIIINEFVDGQITKHKVLDVSGLCSFINGEELNNIVLFFNDGWWIESICDIKCRIHDCKVAIRIGGNDIEKAPWNKYAFSYYKRRELWKNSLNMVDYIIANSNYSVDLLYRLGVEKTKIEKIRGGVSYSYIEHQIAHKRDNRVRFITRFNIKQKYIISFVCRFVPFKGIIQALECIKQSVIKDYTYIVLAGSGIIKDDIINWCAKNLQPNQYVYLGELDEEHALEVLAISDLVVNASLYLKATSGDGFYYHTETMGRTMMEAISLKTKILATDVGGTKELFDENDNIGELVKLDNRAIIKSFDNIDMILCRKHGPIVDYSWQSVFKKYVYILTER